MPKNQSFILICGLILLIASCISNSDNLVTTGSLLDEMTDLYRLTSLPGESYRTIQFSSYDRRSTNPADSFWFSNEDGFGEEPIPGFEKVLTEPDSTGNGKYLICDVNGPGTILRLWSANINGKIRLFLDNNQRPVYEGDAEAFFWKTIESLSGTKADTTSFRQFDATYFPVPFSKHCRIEWEGDIRKIHFYHVGLRLYKPGTKVKTFTPGDIHEFAGRISVLKKAMESCTANPPDVSEPQSVPKIIPAGKRGQLLEIRGQKAVKYLSVKVEAENIESALRKSILRVYFDSSMIPHIEAPIGDFFGAAPGLNPYTSMPFTVHPGGTMICRFIMPFKNSARIVIDNFSDKEVKVTYSCETEEFKWIEGRSMHFRARWKMDNGLTASYFGAPDHDIPDMEYLMAMGKGRIVGAAAFIYNPSNAVASWGNWWGEGDEKIFVDNDRFPSFYGTGSEDYFNYSWSSARIFSHLYCGQPRNEGPGNRGYVSNFRWHIIDDILFYDKLAFYMELGHHGIVTGFSYGRIVYFYALPGLLDNYQKISLNDIKEIEQSIWTPMAYLGSAGFSFIQAEKLLIPGSGAVTESGLTWAEGKILKWRPSVRGEKLKFRLFSDSDTEKARISLTLAHCPSGGTIIFKLNGDNLKFDNKDTLNFFLQGRTVLDNHFSEPVHLNKGNNELVIEFTGSEKEMEAYIDFFWIRK